MIACVDVTYRDSGAVAVCVLFRSWSDAACVREYACRIERVEKYRPGEFYLRELPCILEVLREVREPLTAVVVDGYVWLGATGKAGLGAKLYESLDRVIPVIGVATSMFAGTTVAIAVKRGRSARPLYVTAAGMEPEKAAEFIRLMHGEYRIPTLLKRADRLSREIYGFGLPYG